MQGAPALSGAWQLAQELAQAYNIACQAMACSARDAPGATASAMMASVKVCLVLPSTLYAYSPACPVACNTTVSKAVCSSLSVTVPVSLLLLLWALPGEPVDEILPAKHWLVVQASTRNQRFVLGSMLGFCQHSPSSLSQQARPAACHVTCPCTAAQDRDKHSYSLPYDFE